MLSGLTCPSGLSPSPRALMKTYSCYENMQGHEQNHTIYISTGEKHYTVKKKSEKNQNKMLTYLRNERIRLAISVKNTNNRSPILSRTMNCVKLQVKPVNIALDFRWKRKKKKLKIYIIINYTHLVPLKVCSEGECQWELTTV